MTSAAAIRRRLLQPANGRHSDEREITTRPDWLRRDAKKIEPPMEPQSEAEVAEAWVAEIRQHSCTVKEIVEAVADYYGLTLLDLVSERRWSYLITARHMGMYLARHHTTQGYLQIGRHFGGRDHTTVLHGIRKTESRLPQEKRLQVELGELRAKLGLVESPRVLDQPGHAEG